MRRMLLLGVLAASTLVAPPAARGNSCGLPDTFRAYSSSRRFEVIFEPRGDRRRPQLTIWEWRHDKRVHACRRLMVNSQTPGALFVTDSGYVVTFEDWCRAGYEPALVVYSPRCEVVRDARLEELVSAEDLEHTDRSHGSRHWRYYNEPTFVTESTVSFTSTWGMTATVSVRTYRYEFRGNTGTPEEAEAQDALMRSFRFRSPEGTRDK